MDLNSWQALIHVYAGCKQVLRYPLMLHGFFIFALAKWLLLCHVSLALPQSSSEAVQRE